MPEVRESRILIVDSYPIFRNGLRDVISSESDLRIVGEATVANEVVAKVGHLEPDVVLLENRLPEVATVLGQLDQSHGSVRTIIMVEEIRQNEVLEALRMGARGVFSKESTPELLLKCIRAVIGGQYWIGQDSVSQLIEILRDPSLARKRSFGLTARELQVVGAVIDGWTNREIAGQFSISQQTVKHHLNKIFDKVGVSNRVELAMFAVHHNVLDAAQNANQMGSPG